MGSCVVRRPVFTKGLNIYGYELLFEDDEFRKEEVVSAADRAIRDRRSSKTIIHSFHDLGIARVTNNKRGFVRFTEKLLLDMVATILPSHILVIELDGKIFTAPGVIDACRRLRNKGYLIALDGFSPYENALMSQSCEADIIKIEFDRENRETIKEFAQKLQKCNPHIQLLAKKLETLSDFELAKKCDLKLFQGNFFSKPTVVKNKALLPAPRRHQMLQLMRLSLDSEIDYRAVYDIIKQDLALSYRLLRVINSAFLGLRHTVSNIRQAISILGTKELKKWITLVSLSGLSENKPTELVTMSLVRARFMELIAPHAGMTKQADDLFLMGLMSIMDAVMDMPMTAVVTQTNISAHIAAPLLSREGKLGNLLNLIACYEQSDWDQVRSISAQYDVSPERVFNIYMQALDWTRQLHIGSSV